eukprot:scaffold160_cov136-Cylindrotheca_fusiformis.AAC.10
MSNMESMLMGDDSSSGESDEEVDVSTGRPAATSATDAKAAQRPAPVPAPAPMPVAAPNPGNSQDAMKERLKNLYNSQNKRATPSSQPHPSSAPPQGAPMNPRPGMPQPSNVQPNSHSQSRAPPQMNPTIPTAQPHMGMSRPPSQPRPQQAMQPVRAPLPQQPTQPNQYSRNSHPGQPSRTSHGHPQSQPHRTTQPEVHDPFAPTPLSRIKAREQQQFDTQRHSMPASGGSRTPSTMPGSYSGSRNQAGSSSMYPAPAPARPSGHDPAALAAREQEIRRQKEKFLVFTRVLIKYLESKDPNMHRQAKAIIKDCAERNKKKEPGYQSVTASMKTRLKQLVGENYWKRAELYLKHFMEQKAKANQSNSASSSSHSRQQQQLALQKQQQLKQQQQQQRQKLAQAQTQRQSQVQQPNLSNMQQEVVNRKTEIARTPPSATATQVSGKGSTASKKQAAPKRKSAATPSSRKSTAPTTPTAASPGQNGEKPEDPPREYAELMEMVDHAVEYDWKTAGQLINPKAEIEVDEGQRRLLYGESQPKQATSNEPVPRPGWDKANVLSARGAWARVRLSEQKADPKAPVVANGLLTLPTTMEPVQVKTSTAWINEQTAEQDVVLAMLSEGCQTYIKGILEKAVHCSRQRQNVDGIRLWHQQHEASEESKPALALRLGCDVTRQVAQAHGNAAMTCKRMEEALERQSDVPARSRILQGESLEEATSMADLALRPQLAKGVETADYQAKRLFETFGGKHSSEPPLGRVPKKAKVESIDLVNGTNLTDTIGRHRAVTTSVSAFY